MLPDALIHDSPTQDSPLPIVARASRHKGQVAITDAHGSYTYAELLAASARIASALLAAVATADLHEARIAFLVTPSFHWAATQWGIWRAGGIAVPLPMGATRAELEYAIEDADVSAILCDSAASPVVSPIAEARSCRCLNVDDLAVAESAAASAALPSVALERRAMILYTSGTTSRPKGVVTTHANITAQITSLVEAWEWSSSDRIVLCLPLHHVHGIVNIVCCALWSGATCRMLPRFDAAAIWELIGSDRLTLFMAVPTIYVRLIAAWEAMPPERQHAMSQACRRLRLMVSGSAALPVSTLERWLAISGHTLLERYGMTEIGMALSNPLHGRRIPGSVGAPLPGVEVQLVNDEGQPVGPDTPGEIEVRGQTVFAEYWRRPEATREAFREGWFRTGDTALVHEGSYRILGRTNIDILKTGGHKLSALEIEETLREHPAIAECAVVGVPDEEWGQRVAVAAVLKENGALDLPTLRSWARESLAGYKLPSRLLVVEALPRNAMGKVVKPAVTALLVAAESGAAEPSAMGSRTTGSGTTGSGTTGSGRTGGAR